MLQNRAQAATELLQELNGDVSGNFVEEVGIVQVLTLCHRCFNKYYVSVGNENRNILLNHNNDNIYMTLKCIKMVRNPLPGKRDVRPSGDSLQL